LKSVGKIKDKEGEIIGVQTEAQIVKNRFGPPFKKATFNIYFDSGIDDYSSWLDALKKYKAINQSGAWYEIIMEDTGEVVKFQSKDWQKLLTRTSRR